MLEREGCSTAVEEAAARMVVRDLLMKWRLWSKASKYTGKTKRAVVSIIPLKREQKQSRAR